MSVIAHSELPKPRDIWFLMPDWSDGYLSYVIFYMGEREPQTTVSDTQKFIPYESRPIIYGTYE